jgi:hypothetical protein
MPAFEINCGRVELVVEITFAGTEVRGNPEYRGFSCEHEGACQAGGVECQLFTAKGYRPFEVRDAFEHFDS